MGPFPIKEKFCEIEESRKLYLAFADLLVRDYSDTKIMRGHTSFYKINLLPNVL